MECAVVVRGVFFLILLHSNAAMQLSICEWANLGLTAWNEDGVQLLVEGRRQKALTNGYIGQES